MSDNDGQDVALRIIIEQLRALALHQQGDQGGPSLEMIRDEIFPSERFESTSIEMGAHIQPQPVRENRVEKSRQGFVEF